METADEMDRNLIRGAKAPVDETPAPEPADAKEEDTMPPLSWLYRPLPTNVIQMLPHESRCRLATVDRLRCLWACESGALRRVLLYDSKRVKSLESHVNWCVHPTRTATH